MSFFIAPFNKEHPDREKLKQLLPSKYAQLKIIDYGASRLYLSALFEEISPGAFYLGETKDNAFYCIRLQDNQIHIETGKMRTYPVYRYQDYFSSELKFFSTILGFQYHFRPDEEVLRFNHEDYFTPCLQIENLAHSQLILGKTLVQIKKPSIQFYPTIDYTDQKQAIDYLGELLEQAEKKAQSQTVQASLLSSGIDSSLATAICQKEHFKKSYSISTCLGDELSGAKQIAQAVGISLEEVELKQADLFYYFKQAIVQNEIFDGLTAEILAQTLACVAKVPERTIVSGHGSDLIFTGMLRHLAYMHAVGCETTEDLIRRTIWSGEFRPRAFWELDKQIYYFYWDQDFIENCLRINPKLHYQDGHEKVILREAAIKNQYLPRQLAYFKKTGLTDGTQAHLLLSRQLGLTDHYHVVEKSAWAWDYLKSYLTGLCQ
jgi:asparagine synthetase B (glutamine-hydrolysing)